MSLAIPYRQRLPLGIAVLAFAFLGLFLLVPLFQVFSASFLDSEGTAVTFANYTKMLGRPFYRTAIVNTLEIGAAATAITTVLAVPLAFALARLPIPGKSAILAMASSATGLRRVISSTSSPPSTSALAKGTAWARSLMTITGTMRTAASFSRSSMSRPEMVKRAYSRKWPGWNS